jgi:hypothetical protein
MHREPDHTEDPRGTDTGRSGYPEEQHPGAQPAAPRRDRDDDDETDAPGTSSDEEGGPGQATGNPGAAGG